ncbi:MAG: carboxypeptidase regulatory-like domain-containing protein [Ferruginibacter sp.]
MKKVLIIFLSFFILIPATGLFAQPPGGGNRGSGQNMNMGHFYGKVIEATTNKAISAASVQLLQRKADTVTKTKKDVIVSGMLTTKKGEFTMENLPVMGAYKLLITAIGYKVLNKKLPSR